jgi:hypothetical protein
MIRFLLARFWLWVHAPEIETVRMARREVFGVWERTPRGRGWQVCPACGCGYPDHFLHCERSTGAADRVSQ